MRTFYHVSRADISGIEEFTLKPINDFPGYIENPPIWEEADFRKMLNDYYPAGISRHGVEYLYNPIPHLQHQDGSNWYAVSPMIEITIEFVRKWKFSDKKSRFQSVFACLNIEDAQKLKAERFGGQGSIYEVQCAEHFIGDMNLLYVGNSYVGALIFAEKYWRGEQSHNPFLEALLVPPVRIIKQVF